MYTPVIVLLVVAKLSAAGAAEDASLELSTPQRRTPNFLEDMRPSTLLQLSFKESDQEDGLNDTTRIALILTLNVIGCLVCCGIIQASLYLSKRMKLELNWLRRNYKEYKSLMKFKENRRASLPHEQQPDNAV